MLVVLRIAGVLSDIGVFLNDPGHGWPGQSKRTRLRRCCALGGLAARADASPLSQNESETSYIGTAAPLRHAFLDDAQTLSA